MSARDRLPSYLAAIVAGAAVAAPWLDFGLHRLAWVAFAPLLVAVWNADNRRDAAVLGGLAGLAANVPAFVWLVHTIDVFGGFPLVIAAFFYFCLSLYSASQFALFAAATFQIGPGVLALSAPVLWVALEFVFPNLFPWRMANSQLESPTLMQIGDLTGPYGLSFAIVWVSSALAAWWRDRSAKPMAAALVAVALVFGYGVLRWGQIDSAVEASPPLRAGLVQGNVGIREKGNASHFEINIEKYRALSRSVEGRVDVLVWPETVSHEWIGRDKKRLTRRQHPFPGSTKPLIFGGLGYEYGEADEALRYNAAFLIDAQGVVLGRYNKQILLPFGEFLPLSSWIPFIKEISPNTGDFTAGSEIETLDLAGGARFAPLVCYEDVPARIARAMTARGANVLMTIFNDAWFGDSMAPYQHEAIAVWRAIENRRYFVRVGNAGDTGVVDPWGRVVERLPLFVEGVLVADIRLLDLRTFYTRYGDVFAWAVTVIALLWLAVAVLRPAWVNRS